MIDRFIPPSSSGSSAPSSFADSVAPSLFNDVVRLHSVYCLSDDSNDAQALADFVAAFRRFYAVLPSCSLPEFVAAAPFLAFVADRLDLLLADSDVFGVWRSFDDAKKTIQRVRVASAVNSGRVPGPSPGSVSPASPDSGGASIEVDSSGPAQAGRVPSVRQASVGVPSPSASAAPTGKSKKNQKAKKAKSDAPPSAVDLPPSAITAAILDDLQEGASVRVVAARYGVEVDDVRRVSSALGRVSSASGGD